MSTSHSEIPSVPHRAAAVGIVRALAAAVVLVVLYFVAPLDRVADIPGWVALPIAATGFSVLVGLQVRAILRAPYPGIRALEALGVTLPLFLVAFAATYFVQATEDAANFSQHIDRLDALYFTVTVFTTTGFGDITAVSSASRTTTTVQMVLDLLIIGIGLRLILGAVQTRRSRPPDTGRTGS